MKEVLQVAFSLFAIAVVISIEWHFWTQRSRKPKQLDPLDPKFTDRANCNPRFFV